MAQWLNRCVATKPEDQIVFDGSSDGKYAAVAKSFYRRGLDFIPINMHAGLWSVSYRCACYKDAPRSGASCGGWLEFWDGGGASQP